jgi:hypothetical protein
MDQVQMQVVKRLADRNRQLDMDHLTIALPDPLPVPIPGSSKDQAPTLAAAEPLESP